MPEKNATLVMKLHKCHIFEKAHSSISDVTKETLHEEKLEIILKTIDELLKEKVE